MNKLQKGFHQLDDVRRMVTGERLSLNVNVMRKMLEDGVALLHQGIMEAPSIDGHPDQHFGGVTYSQHGEDLMILNLFKLLGIEKPSYLDLGAHDPFVLSNTALLYARGSRGVNVEANPNLMERFRQLRPEDVNVNVGIGAISGAAKFYMYSDTSGRNTFSPIEVKAEEKLKVEKEIELPVKTLKEIVDEYCAGDYPDLLSCDLEGLDFQILSCLPEEEFTTRPTIICVECRRKDNTALMKMLGLKGYMPLCRMGENLIFIFNTFWKRCF